MLKKLLLFSCFAISMVTARAAYIPVPVTGYNADVVGNGSGAITTSTTADFDGAGYYIFDSTFNPGAAGLPTTFMPSNRLITSATTPGLQFQLAPYNGNNTLRLSGTNTDSLVFSTAQSAGELYFLWTAGSGPSNASASINFTDGTTQPLAAVSVSDWYGGANTVLAIGARWTGTSYDYPSGNPRLYQYQVPILAANQAKLIRSVTFTKTNTSGIIQIMGITRNTVCSGTPTAGTVTASSGASACPGVNFTLSLASGTFGVGITYQWQSSPTGSAPWTTIAGATAATYVANQTATTSYRAYVTCSGTATDTSAPATITVKPTNQCYCVPVSTSNLGTYYISNFTTTGGISNVNNTSTSGTTSAGYSDYSGGTLLISGLQTTTVNFSSLFTGGTFGAKVWVDWNQNGIFEASEQVFTTTSYVSSISGSFTVPITALPGTTKIRIRADYNNSTGPDPCTALSAGQGEAEDYAFNVMQILPCVVPSTQPTALTLTSPTYSVVNGTFTAAIPASDRYLIVRSAGGPLNTVPVNGTTYTVGSTLGNGTIVSAGTSTTIAESNLYGGITYTYTIFSYNSLCSGGPSYLTTTPLTGTVTTLPQGIYSWNGSVSTDWQIAGNWTPSRTVLDPGDILQFNTAGPYTVTNIPTQTVRRITFSGNTTTTFAPTAAATLTINSDNNAATNELDIASGSSAIIAGTANLTLTFGGTGATNTIAGKLEAVNSATGTPAINFSNSVTTVTSAGELAAGAAVTSGANNYTSSATSLLINGTYNHKFTVSSGGGIPTATYNTGSTVLISGYTTATGGPSGGLSQTLFNLTYNCPNQINPTNWSGPNPLNITGTLSVISTGTGTGAWQYSNNTAYALNVGNYNQTGGIFDLSSGNTTSTQTMNVAGTFTKSGGTFKATNTTGSPIVNFAGTAAQTMTTNDVPSGRIVYRFSNPAGVTMVGTGGLTTFNINDNGGIRISTTAANPLTTAMTIAYGTTGTTLTYDTTANYAMTANVFPTAAGPQNLTINVGANNVVTMPFSRTVPGTLTMSSGDINISSNTITLGTTAAAPGSLSYSAGNIRVTTGSMVRWFGTTGLPTTAANTGLYPLAAGAFSRQVNVYFTTATALTTGGTIAVGHTTAIGFTGSLSIADGAYTINQRTNASWGFATGNGIAGAGNVINMRLLGTGLFTTSTPANLRVMQATTVVGTHAAGSAPAFAVRTGMALTDLGVPYYIGAANADMAGAYIAINTGAWSVGTTWDVGTAPGVVNDAYINPGVTVTADAATNTAKSLNILSGGALNVNTGALTIDSALLNAGTVNVGGGTLLVNGSTGATGITNNRTFNITSGTVTLGPVGGGLKPFTNNATMAISGGTLNINGNLNCVAASIFSQTGGSINVDGNAGGVAANSVASGTAIVSFKSQFLTLTGGNLTIVDPHANSTATNTFEYNNSTAHVDVLPPHTLILGDGTSTDAGGNATNGFRLNTWPGSNRISFGNVIVNGGAGTNRFVSNTYGFGINGNITINNNGELRLNSTLYAAGNINIAAGGLFTTQTNSFYFSSYLSGTIGFVTTPQTVTNNGTIRNSTSATPTANVASVYFYNTNGVTFNQDLSFSGSLLFNANAGVPSKAIMAGTNRMIEIAGAGGSNSVGATTGWVVGRYQKAAGTGGMNNNYPIGDVNAYAPVNVTGTVLTAGALWASTTGGDHPNLSTSTFNPGATVNRYYTLDTLNGITFTPTTISATFNYSTPDLDANLLAANLQIGRYKGTTWTYPTVSTPSLTSIKATGLDNNIAAQFAIGEPCAPIVIVNAPVNKTGCIGSPISFSVGVAPKAGVTYQWKKGATNIVGATDSIYTIPVVAATDAGSYTVTISSGCSSVTPITTTAVTLSINNPATITTQPAAAPAFCQGSPGTLSVTATGTAITYQWKKAGVAITGATASSYTIPVVALADAGNYTVDVIGTAPCGTVTSIVSAVTVKPLPLTITAASTTSFCVGNSVVLNASTTPGTLTYQWQNNGTNITGQTGSSYTATASGSYTVLITDTNPANGCTSPSNAIIVNASGAPQAIINPAGSAAYCQGSSVTLRGNSTAGLTYEWLKNGNTTPVGLDSTYVANTPGSYVLKVSIGSGCSTTSTPTVVTENPLPVVTTVPVGAQSICQNDTLSISAVYNNATIAWRLNGNLITPAATGNIYKATASGNYSVTATNTATGCVSTSAPVTLTVNPLPVVNTTSLNATTFCAGGSDTLLAAPTTGLTYVWNRAGAPITPLANQASYVALVSGSYTVTGTNANGCKATAAPIVVTVNPLPSVAVTPSNGLTICQGQTTNLCVPSVAAINYQWKLGTANITGATTACYSATTPGNYTVTATNSITGCAATSTVSAVVVNPIPVATIVPPASTSVCAGDTVCLSANTGAGLTYQWRLNGNAIVGATNQTYCITTSGTYTVTVTNGSNCSVTAPNVVMTVNPRPTANITYTTPVTFCEGGAVVLTGVSNTGITYQWQNNGLAVPGATNNSYIAASTGNYSIRITNSFGCTSISPTIVVISNPIPTPVITRAGTSNLLTTGSYASYQWYVNSQPISGATNQSVNALQNGGYAVRVIDANGCTNYSSVVFVNNVGIGGNPTVAPASVKVFPNPVRNMINIDAPAPVNVVLRDLTGRMIKQMENVKQLDMTGLPDGYYMLMISDKNGIMIKAEKVMKVAE